MLSMKSDFEILGVPTIFLLFIYRKTHINSMLLSHSYSESLLLIIVFPHNRTSQQASHCGHDTCPEHRQMCHTLPLQFLQLQKINSLFWKWMGCRCCPSSHVFLCSEQKRNKGNMPRVKKWSLCVPGKGVGGERGWKRPHGYDDS